MISFQASIAENYELVFPEDPALDTEAPDFLERWRKAAEGMLPWQELCKPGATPTVWVMRNIPGSQWRRISEHFSTKGENGLLLDAMKMFALSLVEVKNAAGLSLSFTKHPELGLKMLDDKTIDQIDFENKMIISTLGSVAFQRNNLPPKR